MTTVSVVIPYFNRSEWLWPALESVLRQTFEDLEVIVVDDGSTEEIELSGRFRDPRIRYVRQAHGGASAARNHGLRLANGRYVAFLDADDVFVPEKLDLQIRALEDRPQAALVHTSYVRMDEHGNDIEEIRSGTFSGNVYPAIVMECPIATPTVMIRKDALDRSGLTFDESVRVGEDVIMWIELARRHEFLGIDAPLTRVRIHGHNAFADARALYQGGMAILRHSFDSDTTFGLVTRRRAFARLCANVGYRHLDQGDRSTALRFFVRAIKYWPFDWQTGVMAARMLVPQKLRAALGRRRASARSPES